MLVISYLKLCAVLQLYYKEQCVYIYQSDPSVTSSQETPAPGTSEAKQWEEDWDDAGWDDEDQDT